MKKKCAKILSILLLVVITINGNLFVVYGAIAEGNIVLNAGNISYCTKQIVINGIE